MTWRIVFVAALLTGRAAVVCAQTEHEKELEARIDALEKRVAQLEQELQTVAVRLAPAPMVQPSAVPAHIAAPAASAAAPPVPQQPVLPAPTGTAQTSTAASPPAEPAATTPLPSVDVNLMLDGYFGYNFNNPLGHINLLRAYDVLSDNFSLNQADLMVERQVDPANGRRFGARLDLQFGQATATLQGNPNNEPRPQFYNNIFQAYGTYVAPLGRGLTLDFGKWASALGIEGNYTKDDINYSRSYWFNFLPFYHFGLRASYNFTDSLSAQYWLVNGENQSEDFNSAKSQNFEIIAKPVKSITWTTNYYFGNENISIIPIYNPGPPVLPTQPGLSTNVIQPAPNGLTHIFDSYATWNATKKLTFAIEADDVIRRYLANSAPQRVTGGALYAQYRFNDRFALGTRAEYLDDQNGLFSGVPQALKENTVTFDYVPSLGLPGSGFLVRMEWRRDFSNQPFFLTNIPGVLKKEQNTATLGLIWWFGPHAGSW